VVSELRGTDQAECGPGVELQVKAALEENRVARKRHAGDGEGGAVLLNVSAAVGVEPKACCQAAESRGVNTIPLLRI